MKTFLFMTFSVSLFFITSIAGADSLCGSAGRGWPSDTDGSMWLTNLVGGKKQSTLELALRQGLDGGNQSTLELILRKDDGIIVARGITPMDKKLKIPVEVYSLYDLSSGMVVRAVAKGTADVKEWKDKFNRNYSMQSIFDIKVYSADDQFKGKLATLLAENKEKDCHEELVKRNQGRSYDKQKCGEIHARLNDVMATLVGADGISFEEVTKNPQVAKYIANFRERRGKDYCTGIQWMVVNILEDMKNPDTQKKLATRKKMPGYLDPDSGGLQKEIHSFDRVRY